MIGVTKAGFALAALLLLRLAFYPGPQSPANVVEKSCGPARYYIITKARLQSPEMVHIFGASNLPTGSVLYVSVYDYIGH